MLAECVHTRVLVQRPDLHHSHRRQCVKGEAGGGMGIRRERASAYLVLLRMHTLRYSYTCTDTCTYTTFAVWSSEQEARTRLLEAYGAHWIAFTSFCTRIHAHTEIGEQDTVCQCPKGRYACLSYDCWLIDHAHMISSEQV